MDIFHVRSFHFSRSVNLNLTLFILLVLVFWPIFGQSGHQKKNVLPEDYPMWHNMRFPLISGDGKWVSYLLDYKPAQDTLVVMDINGQIKCALPNANGGQFAPNKHPNLFACTHPKKGVGLLNLFDETISWTTEAKYYEFSMNGKFIAFYDLKPDHGYLKLMDIKNNRSIVINNALDFKFDPTGKWAAFIFRDNAHTAVKLLNLNNFDQSIVTSSSTSGFQSLTWNALGNGLAFLECNNNSPQRLYYFENNEAPALKEISNSNISALGNLRISNLSPTFSIDGERIFFFTHHTTNTPIKQVLDTVKVQVWKGSDKLVYPRSKLYHEFEIKDKMAVWWPKTGKVFQIGTPDKPKVILTEDQKFALSYNPLEYEPQFIETAKSDYYITDLETGKTKKFLDKMETAPGYFSISPIGKWMAYFKENNWWLYNFQKGVHYNATANIEVPLTYKHPPGTTRITPFGYMGWTSSNEFLIYDEFDIWKINSTGSMRLTAGRDSKTTYRKYFHLYNGFYPPGKTIKDSGYNLSKDIILETLDSVYNRGFAKLKSTREVIPFLKKTGIISGLRKAKFEDSYVFMREKYNEPKKLYRLQGTKHYPLAESNPQQKDFYVGKTELISFNNNEGDNLKGILHYPDNYHQGNRYPMVVSVYQIIAPQFQKYHNPSMYNEEGFNIRNFTAAGYFVLEPDILIQNENPGVSATDCTVAAIKEVLTTGMIDESAIGLIGHSFGGYEAAFIITQTDIFAAAVVGSGVFDVTSFAHTVNPETGMVGFIDIEDKQWKMKKSYYDAKEKYRRNSPLEYAHKITTPTLIYTGNHDFRIDWHQSLEMYLSMRRLGAKVELLVYENEFHTLTGKENQKDLTQRIETWFSKYLKK